MYARFLEQGLGRTNNSVQGWHSYWNAEIALHPRLSQLVKRIKQEDSRWQDMVRKYHILQPMEYVVRA
jgi:hypothetical protein